jgi:hypothetical protein
MRNTVCTTVPSCGEPLISGSLGDSDDPDGLCGRRELDGQLFLLLDHPEHRVEAATREWAVWLYNQLPWAQEILWQSVADMPRDTLVLFEDRCTGMKPVVDIQHTAGCWTRRNSRAGTVALVGRPPRTVGGTHPRDGPATAQVLRQLP